MGPYCKFCNNRCFVPTDEGLRASCDEGKRFDDSIAELRMLSEATNKTQEQIERIEAIQTLIRKVRAS